jgi:sulfur carrier protein ThiS
MKVKVLKLGYAAREIDVSQGLTVEESIRASGMDDSGFKITVNGVGAELSALVRENDVIALVPKVEGGFELRTPACF